MNKPHRQRKVVSRSTKRSVVQSTYNLSRGWMRRRELRCEGLVGRVALATMARSIEGTRQILVSDLGFHLLVEGVSVQNFGFYMFSKIFGFYVHLNRTVSRSWLILKWLIMWNNGLVYILWFNLFLFAMLVSILWFPPPSKASWYNARESAQSGGTIYYKHYYRNKLFE